MPKPLDGEVLDPEHAYDNPDLSNLDFLRAVRNDKRLPMPVRIDAAKAAIAFEHPRLAQVAQDVTSGVRIIIEGGLPALPGTNIIMPDNKTAPRKPNGGGNGSSQP